MSDLESGKPLTRPSGAEVYSWVETLIATYREGPTAAPFVGRLKELTKYLGRLVGDDRIVKRCLRSKSAEALLEELKRF